MTGELGKAIRERLGAKMPHQELEAHLARRLREVKMCALVTCNANMGRGTPLEYFADGLDLYIVPDPGTKTRNLAVNPNVSVSVFNNCKPDWEREWAQVWGMQITGVGKLYEGGTPEHARAKGVVDVAGYCRAMGRDYTQIQDRRKILKISVSKIELTDFGLLDKGYYHVQVWRAASPPPGPVT